MRTLFESVQILRLQPGDVLVVEVERSLDSKMAEDLRKQVEEEFPGHKVLVTSGVKLIAAREVEASVC